MLPGSSSAVDLLDRGAVSLETPLRSVSGRALTRHGFPKTPVSVSLMVSRHDPILEGVPV